MTFEEARAELRRLADEAGYRRNSISLKVEAWDYPSLSSQDEPECEFFISGPGSCRFTAHSLPALVAKVRSDLAPQGATPCT